MAASAYLTCLKKVHKKIRSKEYRLVEQGLYNLKAEEARTGSNRGGLGTAPHTPAAESLVAPGSPLADLFFNPSFSLLPDLLSFNTP